MGAGRSTEGALVQDLMWYLSRSTGIVAAILAVASVAWGTLFSARETGNRLRPAWWLDLHNWLGGAALAFTVLHLAAVLAHRDAGIGIADALVPAAAPDQTLGVGLGIVAMYTFVIAVFTSWPTRRFDRRVWRILHLTSVAGLAAALVHTYRIGTDATTLAGRIGMVVAVGVSVYVLSLRLIGVWTHQRGRRAATRSAPAPDRTR